MTNLTNPLNANFIAKLANIVHKKNIITNKEDLAEFLLERRGNFTSKGKIAVLANNTKEVAEIIKLCNTFNVKLVIQGGNSSLVGSTVSSENELILSLKNLNVINSISKENFTIVAGSGVKLQSLQQLCKEKDLYFPFDIPSREICTLGGLASTNAGGITALKYGVFKDLVQGLEVVLADGTIINDIHTNKKRNIGANISSLFLGAEGINGVITKVSLKCTPLQKYEVSFIVSATDIANILDFYNILYSELFDFVESFEIINNYAFNIGKKYINSTNFNGIFFKKDWFALIKLSTRSSYVDLNNILKQFLKKYGNIVSYLLPNNEDNKELWQIRSHIHKGQKQFFKHGFKHDIAIPLNKIKHFILDGVNICYKIDKHFSLILFGHAGDGNIHFNVCTNKNLSTNEKENIANKLKDSIFTKALELGGTFSAEHGIGFLNKKYLLKYHKNHNKILLKIKLMLDKKSILNNNKTVVK